VLGAAVWRSMTRQAVNHAVTRSTRRWPALKLTATPSRPTNKLDCSTPARRCGSTAPAQRQVSAAGVLIFAFGSRRHASRLETVVGPLHHQECPARTELLTRCGVASPADWRKCPPSRRADFAIAISLDEATGGLRPTTYYDSLLSHNNPQYTYNKSTNISISSHNTPNQLFMTQF
jgi:hypothetical protein